MISRFLPVRGWLALALALGALTLPSRAVQRQTAMAASSPNHYSFKYLCYLPPGYDADPSAKWPLMVFLHGSGQSGSDLEVVAAAGPTAEIERGRDFPCVVISPQAPTTNWDPAELEAFILDRVKEYRIDPNRIYLTGLSMGGYGTWALAQKTPELYAAVMPLCGGGDPSRASKLKDLPLWAFHGSLDPIVPVNRTQEMIDAIRQAGGDPLVTIYPTLGHDVWTITYANSEVYTWLFRQSRLHLAAAPVGVALDSRGNLYLTDRAGNIVRKMTPAGVVSTLAGSTGTAGSADGSGVAARFNQPGAIAADGSGNLYVADAGNATIRKTTSEGTVTTLAGSASSRGSADGPAGTATFNAPGGIAVDGAGNVYVADTLNATIRRITPAGVTSTYAGNAGNRGDQDGSRTSARFTAPGGLALDPGGNVYVADGTSNTIRRIAPDGTVTTLAGTPGVSGATDGTGREALFSQPGGLAVDAAGNLYVADTGNATVRKITPLGMVTTMAGLRGIAGLTDGVGNRAYFNSPQGLAADGAGNLYVADTGNSVIRKIATGAVVTTLAPAEASAPAPAGGTSTPAITPTNPNTAGTANGGTGTGTGGGGAVSGWFIGIMAVLAAVRLGCAPARADESNAQGP